MDGSKVISCAISPSAFFVPAGMREGTQCWCSGAVDKGTLRVDSDCEKDCVDDPASNKRKCGGGWNIFSVWRLGKNYCSFKSKCNNFKVCSHLLLDWHGYHYTRDLWKLHLRKQANRPEMCYAANMFCAAIFDDVLNFHVLIMICAFNINQSTNNLPLHL